jgi:hypothetical protein
LFSNLTSSISAIFFDIANTISENGHKVVNCSFEKMKSIGEYPISIGVFDPYSKYNITNCFFRNLSSNSSNIRGGAINCEMINNNNYGYYDISGNTFIDIKTNKSVITLNGSFSSLIFSYNSFYNVSSSGEGGVYLFFFNYIYFKYLGDLGRIYNNNTNSYFFILLFY